MSTNFTFKTPICEEVKEVLKDFQNRESAFMYSSKQIRELFTLKQKEDWLEGTLTLEEYIIKHNLREISEAAKKERQRQFIIEYKNKMEKQRQKEIYYDELEAKGYFDNYEEYDSDYVETESEYESDNYNNCSDESDSDL